MYFFPSNLPCGVFSFGSQPKGKVLKTKSNSEKIDAEGAGGAGWVGVGQEIQIRNTPKQNGDSIKSYQHSR